MLAAVISVAIAVFYLVFQGITFDSGESGLLNETGNIAESAIAKVSVSTNIDQSNTVMSSTKPVITYNGGLLSGISYDLSTAFTAVDSNNIHVSRVEIREVLNKDGEDILTELNPSDSFVFPTKGTYRVSVYVKSIDGISTTNTLNIYIIQ